MAFYHYQCGTKRCRQRYSFRKPLELYARPPRAQRRQPGLTAAWGCGRCGGNLNPCSQHVRRWNRRQDSCECGMVPYRHRRGSRHGEWLCEAHPEFDPFPESDPYGLGASTRAAAGEDCPF